MPTRRSAIGRSGQPAICITHHAAMEYCRWLSEKTGKLYRLPTEAEWEYACRAGTKTAYFWGDELDKIDEYAWYVNNAEKPMPVGKKKPSPWGLYDIHGNVAEWCLDHYVADAYKQFAAAKPCKGPVILPDAKEYPYVVRGGSWDDDAELLRSAARRGSNLEWSVQDPQRPQSIWWHTDATFAGFRIVRPLERARQSEGTQIQGGERQDDSLNSVRPEPLPADRSAGRERPCVRLIPPQTRSRRDNHDRPQLEEPIVRLATWFSDDFDRGHLRPGHDVQRPRRRQRHDQGRPGRLRGPRQRRRRRRLQGRRHDLQHQAPRHGRRLPRTDQELSRPAAGKRRRPKTRSTSPTIAVSSAWTAIRK